MSQAPPIKRKLTTILSADAANYSGRMARDEVGTVQALRASRTIIDAQIAMRGGRIANTSGDGLIAEFPSVVEAVAAAVSIQRNLKGAEHSLPFRLGLHLGDVIIEGQDLLGDGVNLAARLQEMAPEGGILVSQQIVDQAKGRLEAGFRPLGPTSTKHQPEEIALFAIEADGVTAPDDLDRVTPRHDAAAPEPKPTNPSSKVQTGLLVIIGFFFTLDLITGDGIGWFLYPSLPFGALYLLLRIWRRD